MRVLFACYPAHAHFYPFATTAWALQSAGHDVRVATFHGLTNIIAAAGLTPVPLGDPDSIEARFLEDAGLPSAGDEIDRYAQALAIEPHERDAWDVFYQYMLLPCGDYLRPDRPEAAQLVEFTRTWQPDLVIYDPTFPIAAIAAKACGAAQARFLLGPDIYAWSLDRLAAYREQVLAAGLDENPLGSMIKPVAERLGVEMGDDLLYGHWSLDAVSPGLRMPTSAKTVPVRYVPFAGASELPGWLYEKPQRPRVAVSLGVSTRQAYAGSHVRDEAERGENAFEFEANPEVVRLTMLMEALGELDVEVIATLSEGQLAGIPPLPANVRAVHYLPLPQLLPTCTALIHHGGIGTLAAATGAEVPQLIFDTGEAARVVVTVQEDGSIEYAMPDKKVEATWTSTFVMDHGAGERLNHKTQSVEEMRKLIQQVLENQSYRDGARALHDEWLATPGPNDIVPTLEVLTAHHRSR
ncbi:nucleotide disphospho-sugar-binding domain-containing protein [Amycolatopsis sp. CA-128772]|uniref:nucleotide disphospho-sugar-binding domain-containing protein n=1 Tax=Amycolatopsis sp. CA-128772 TaxID=2073159 RepID=UPI0013048151|nr:nucleotide disphospho-sugar-binding domain-containing protein [Amycolatopsis sp. CA-128772]